MPIPLKLTVYKGSDLVGEHRFDRDIVKIGRLASAHLKLDDTKVSRIHAVIEATSDGQYYSIIDMGSTEGTFVNGEKVSKEKLKDGDEIRLGDCRLVVAFEESDVRAAPQPEPVAMPAPSQSNPQELWAATSQDLAMASPTMSFAPASPVAAQVDMQGGYSGASMQSSMPPPSPPSPTQPMQQMQMQHQPMTDVAMPVSGLPIAMPVHVSGWGAVPNNLASDGVPETERALEIKTLWGANTCVDTINVYDKLIVTMGDERKTTGWGPFQKMVRCDVEVPSKGLPMTTFPFALLMSQTGCSYAINIPDDWTGRVERADGSVFSLDDLIRSGRGMERGDLPNVNRYSVNPAETLYLNYHDLTFQVRYVRKQRFIPPPFLSELNYSWVNMFILAFFIHAMAIVSFIATPTTQAELSESLFKNPNRFAQFRLTPEEKKKQQNDFLSKLKEGAAGAKHAGAEGKAGRKDHPKDAKQGRMAVVGKPNEKELAKSMLDKLFGQKGNVNRSFLMGTGGLGGELKGALGGVQGAEIGDATGLGGLGTRGSGPGGGGLSMNSVGLGALGTQGRGGGNGGYGEGVGGLGKKADRDINISAGSPIIMGSLDKEIIRRVIKQHLAQIRYCYEKELTRSPGLFGKVATQFTISAQGTVSSADVTDSTLHNPEVERCITSKIHTWVFPKPKGGGIVIVKYPFIFKTTG
jgi:FHA domain-containing protein